MSKIKKDLLKMLAVTVVTMSVLVGVFHLVGDDVSKWAMLGIVLAGTTVQLIVLDKVVGLRRRPLRQN